MAEVLALLFEGMVIRGVGGGIEGNAGCCVIIAVGG